MRACCEMRGQRKDACDRAFTRLHPIKLLPTAKTRFTFTIPSSGHASRWRANVTWRGTFRRLEHDAAAMHINRTPHARSLTSSHCRAFHSGSSPLVHALLQRNRAANLLDVERVVDFAWTWRFGAVVAHRPCEPGDAPHFTCSLAVLGSLTNNQRIRGFVLTVIARHMAPRFVDLTCTHTARRLTYPRRCRPLSILLINRTGCKAP